MKKKKKMMMQRTDSPKHITSLHSWNLEVQTGKENYKIKKQSPFSLIL